MCVLRVLCVRMCMSGQCSVLTVCTIRMCARMRASDGLYPHKKNDDYDNDQNNQRR